LQIIEMLFYAQLRNKDIAAVLGVDETHIAVVKHRWLKQARQRVAGFLAPGGPGASSSSDRGTSEMPDEALDSLLTEAWEQQRPSCLKRSTIGGYVLDTLDKPWHDFVDFHIHRLGCASCRANLEDLQKETQKSEQLPALRHRILQSTVGF